MATQAQYTGIHENRYNIQIWKENSCQNEHITHFFLTPKLDLSELEKIVLSFISGGPPAKTRLKWGGEIITFLGTNTPTKIKNTKAKFKAFAAV